MNFDFSEEQELLRDQAKRLLVDQAAPREILDGDAPYNSALWEQMAALGWMGTAIPEEYGGLGLGHEELCVIAEELGAALAPTPYSSSVYLATEALLLAGSDAQKQVYLPDLAEGQSIGCFALAEGIAATSSQSLQTRFSDGRLQGSKALVADGDVADLAVVLAAGEEGPQLCVAALNDPSVKIEPVDTVDPTRSHARVTFDNTAAEPLGDAGAGWELTRHIQDRAAVLVAFEQVGGAQACLDMAVDYAKNRYAFGRPIGSFQAIKHKLADVYVATEIARSNAYYGAWALNTGAADLPVAAAAARVAACEAFNLAARENIQTHGGMGFTWEADCHMYYRRAKLLSLMLGGERRWKDRLVGQLETRNSA